MNIIVIGAGVIGVTTAYCLARDGHEVTLVDRGKAVAGETSYANGGQISAGQAEPWAAPATPWLALRWLGQADAPFAMRLRSDPRLWAWAARFLGNCLPARHRANAHPMLRLALYSRTMLAALRRETAIDYDGRAAGILKLYRQPRALEAAARAAEALRPFGLRQEVVDAPGCVRIEPALGDTRQRLAGGIYSPDDESGDAHLFTTRLAEICVRRGVVFRLDRTVKGMAADGGRIVGLATEQGPLTADAYVVAAGAEAPLLLRGLGLRLPIYPVKGYSVTLPAGEGAPTVSITDEARRIVVSRIGDRLRAAGIAELAGYDTSVDPRRAGAVLNGLMALFPRGGDVTRVTYWACLRPMTAAGPPILGPTRYPNLWLNVGHGALGWTMACGAARVVADLIAGRAPDVDPAGLVL